MSSTISALILKIMMSAKDSLDKFNEILEDYSKENMRKRDLARRKYKSESHYRIQSSNWKDVFTSRHEELFNAINGDLLKVLNYWKIKHLEVRKLRFHNLMYIKKYFNGVEKKLTAVSELVRYKVLLL